MEHLRIKRNKINLTKWKYNYFSYNSQNEKETEICAKQSLKISK